MSYDGPDRRRGPTFDQLVRETAFAGETAAEIAGLRTDVTEIKGDVKDLSGDVKHVRSQIDRWGGAIALIGACISAIVSVAVALFVKLGH